MEVSGSCLTRILGNRLCLTMSAKGDECNCLDEETCKPLLDISWKVRSKDLTPFLEVRKGPINTSLYFKAMQLVIGYLLAVDFNLWREKT